MASNGRRLAPAAAWRSATYLTMSGADPSCGWDRGDAVEQHACRTPPPRRASASVPSVVVASVVVVDGARVSPAPMASPVAVVEVGAAASVSAGADDARAALPAALRRPSASGASSDPPHAARAIVTAARVARVVRVVFMAPSRHAAVATAQQRRAVADLQPRPRVHGEYVVTSTEGDGMRIRVLGPVAVERDGVPVNVGGSQQRRLLALLVLQRGRAVSAERVVDALWPDGDAPDGAARSMRTYLSRLRTVLPGHLDHDAAERVRPRRRRRPRRPRRVRRPARRGRVVGARPRPRPLRRSAEPLARRPVRRVRRRVVGAAGVDAAQGARIVGRSWSAPRRGWRWATTTERSPTSNGWPPSVRSTSGPSRC